MKGDKRMKKYSEEWLKEKELRHREARERKEAMENEKLSWNGTYNVGVDGLVSVDEKSFCLVQWYR